MAGDNKYAMPNLKIKTITNRELSCTYEDDYTVRMLKENIEHKEGMPPDQFKLIFMGQQMVLPVL